jgi:adenylate cyclase
MKRPWLRAWVAGFATALIGVLLMLTPLGTEFERGVGLSWLFKLRGPVPPPAAVAVVAIDDQTGSRLGLSTLPRDWPRSIHGTVVDNLTRHGAAAIVFDFDFQVPKKAEDDAAFAAAVQRSGRVVLTEKLVGKRQPLFDAQGKQTGSVWMEQSMPPVAPLAQAAKGLGSFPLPKVDVAVHEFWAFKSSVGNAPTMPAVALQIQAMAAYAKMLAHIRTIDPALAADLPAPLAPATRAEELRQFMQQLRALFLRRAGLGAELRAMLGDGSAAEMTALDSQLAMALIGLYEGGDHRLLNFYGPPGSVMTIPYHVAAGEDTGSAVLPDLTGKVVFVGFSDLYDPGQPDRFYTVFTNDDGVDLSGVEIAATAYANLLTGRSVEPMALMAEIGVLALFGGVVAVLAYGLPAIAGVPIVMLLAATYAYATHVSFSQAERWLPLATPMLVQLPLALFVGLIAQYLSERDKKQRATRAISMYLPEHLARDFTEKNLDESALNRVTYSVCFASDMAGFTTIAETLKPKDLAAFLNDYFESLSEPLRRHKVDVIEFRADGIMCAWTAEQADVAIRRSAVLAALESLQTIARFKDRHALLAQSLRIGLETGMVYVGHAGGGGHFVYSIVGDCANTAARIESLNKHLGTQLLATRSATEGVEGMLLRFVGEFRFVGKTEALPIVEIMGHDAIAGDSVRALHARFAEAMQAMKDLRWSQAIMMFEGILADFPEDGPSRFHLARCRGFADAPPVDSPWLVRMDSK